MRELKFNMLVKGTPGDQFSRRYAKVSVKAVLKKK